MNLYQFMDYLDSIQPTLEIISDVSLAIVVVAMIGISIVVYFDKKPSFPKVALSNLMLEIKRATGNLK